MNGEREKTVNSEREKTVNGEREKTVNSEREKTVNGEREKTVNSEREKTVNSEREKTVNSEWGKRWFYIFVAGDHENGNVEFSTGWQGFEPFLFTDHCSLITIQCSLFTSKRFFLDSKIDLFYDQDLPVSFHRIARVAVEEHI